MLRLYGGIFETATNVNLDLLSKKTGQTVENIIPVLEKLERDGIIELSLRVTDATITFLKPREDDRTINVVKKEVEALNTRKTKQVASVIRYIENDIECKSRQLVSYFGESTSEKCGICSVCASQETMASKDEMKLISAEIRIFLEEEAMSSRSISEKSTFAESKIIHVLRLLVDSGKISLNTKNQYYIN